MNKFDISQLKGYAPFLVSVKEAQRDVGCIDCVLSPTTGVKILVNSQAAKCITG